ncbi:MAG: DUF1844 domain-containing protein [Candidatus Neomarinimicrobiota bacterium]|nr:MAG: DUF1844 domain-containing protein [Candidatus Neomarinimicrobiota bacterium]
MTLQSGLTEDQLFDQLISSIVHTAWLALGRMKHPHTGKVETNLKQAAITIDMLDMLYKRLDRSLKPEEDAYLSSLLGELKDTYEEEIRRQSSGNSSDAPEANA